MIHLLKDVAETNKQKKSLKKLKKNRHCLIWLRHKKRERERERERESVQLNNAKYALRDRDLEPLRLVAPDQGRGVKRFNSEKSANDTLKRERARIRF